jgi:hypothetical protein
MTVLDRIRQLFGRRRDRPPDAPPEGWDEEGSAGVREPRPVAPSAGSAAAEAEPER